MHYYCEVILNTLLIFLKHCSENSESSRVNCDFLGQKITLSKFIISLETLFSTVKSGRKVAQSTKEGGR